MHPARPELTTKPRRCKRNAVQTSDRRIAGDSRAVRRYFGILRPPNEPTNRASRRTAPQLDARGDSQRLFARAAGADFPGAGRPSQLSRATGSAALPVALDQDGRLSGGLRVLPPERALPD